MKYKVLIPLLLVAFVGVSWFSLFQGTYERTNSYHNLIKKADESFEKELYQQAYGYYEEAFQMNASEEVEDKIIDSYRAFDEEQGTSNTHSAYLDSLNKACERFTGTEKYWEMAIRENMESEKYDKAMELCKAASREKIKSDAITELRKQVLYSFKLGGHACSAYQNAVNGYFMVQTGTTRAMLSSDAEDYESLDEVEVGGVGEDDIYLAKDMENRIRFVDLNGIIRGKVNLDISEFGVYSEGFCSAKYQDHYCFIDLDGNILIDGLQYAGCFQNGKAVIQNSEGKWAFIDSKGKICTEYFDAIKVDYIGRYLFEDKVIVKEQGKYKLYDDEMKKEMKVLSASEIDIPVEKGWVAYCEDGKWGFMDSDGEVKIKPQYESAKSFSNGLAAVCENDMWGMINHNNELIVDYQFLDIGYMSEDGVCYVSDLLDYYQTLVFNFANEFTK